MTVLRVGIMSYDGMKRRTMAIARGEVRPGRDDPAIWFTSLDSFAKVLSERNRALLALIAAAKPRSVTELSRMSGRAMSNLSRTLRTMERYGLVDMRRGARGVIAPRVPYSRIALSLGLAHDVREPATKAA